MIDAISTDSRDSQDENSQRIAQSDSSSPRSSVPKSIQNDFDFLSLLTGIKADGSSIYSNNIETQLLENSSSSSESESSSSSSSSSLKETTFDESEHKNYKNTQQKDSQIENTEPSEDYTKKHKHRLWHFGSRNSQKTQKTQNNTNSETPHFTVLPTAPICEQQFGIYDNRDGKVFDSTTRLRLHTLIATCLMNGIADQRVSALMHLLQWQNNPKIIVIAGTYGAIKHKDNGPTRHIATHEFANNTDSLRRAVWPILGSCNAYDAIVESVQNDAIERIAHAWNISSATQTSSFSAPSHIILLAIREDPSDQALEKLCQLFAPSKKPIAVSRIAQNVNQVADAITATLASLAVAPAVNHLPNIIHTDDVLPERALIGDSSAIETLYKSVYQSLAPYSTDDPTLPTVDMFLRFGGALDQTAHELNVHPNTVRYRLRKVAQTTGWDATDPREAYVLQTAITIGRIRDALNN